MEDQRKLLLAIVLSMIILVGFQLMSPQKPQMGQMGQTETGTSAQTDQTSTEDTGIAVPAIERQTRLLARNEALAQTQRITIESPRLNGSINLKGARIDDLVLNDYRETNDPNSPPVKLFSPQMTERPFFAGLGWIASTDPFNQTTTQIPDNNTVWQASSSRLTPDQPVTLLWQNPQGVIFQIVYRLKDDFLVEAIQEVINPTESAVTVFPYGYISRANPQGLGFQKSQLIHEGLIAYLNEQLYEFDYSEAAEASEQAEKATGGWIGITDHYWLAAFVPDQKTEAIYQFRHQAREPFDRFQVNYAYPAKTVEAGQNAQTTTHLFAGAKELNLLEQYEDDLSMPHFDLAVDFGWFYFLTKPLFYLLRYLFEMVGNFGVAIILLTVLVKLAFLPLANKSYVAMNRLKDLQPKMKEIQETYKDDRQRLMQEMRALYQEEKINPMSGCLPILIQIPVFFALYKVLFVTIEMRHQPFAAWIQDLSAPDPTSMLNLFGLLPFESPVALSFLAIGALPLIMGISMFLQQMMNPTPADKTQAMIFKFMPIIFTFILASFPAGLVLYWTSNNILSLGQQWWIRKRNPRQTS